MNHLYQLNQNVRDTGAQWSLTSNRVRADRSERSAATRHAFERRGLGNQAMQNLLKARVIRAKLSVSQPNDQYEQEADRVAEKVMRMPESDAAETVAGRSPSQSIQRVCQPCEEEGLQPGTNMRDVMRKAQSDDTEQEAGSGAPDEQRPEGEEEDGRVLLKALSSQPRVDHNLKGRLARRTTRGQVLPNGVRSFMEARFNADFGAVSIHTDSDAAKIADEIQAAAFTHGRHIYFNHGRYDPESRSGRSLLAHELTHVIQQGVAPEMSAGNIAPNPRGTVSRQALPHISPLGRRDLSQLQRRTEAHLNLDTPQSVRLFHHTGRDIIFSPVSAGDNTEPLAGRGFSLTKRDDPTRREGRWGLQYFAPFRGGIGFHSRIAYPTMATLCALPAGSALRSQCDPRARPGSRVRVELTVDGHPRSHGCVRMIHSDARTLFGTVSNGDRVFVYHGAGWQEPSWSPTSTLRPRRRRPRTP